MGKKDRGRVTPITRTSSRIFFMNPYPQYLKALEMKTDGKGHIQAEKTSVPARETARTSTVAAASVGPESHVVFLL